jgi:hypothetical protein
MHAAKHRNPTHPEPVPDLLVTVIMADVCGFACWDAEAMGMRGPDAG